jgi:hypothetical protein
MQYHKVMSAKKGTRTSSAPALTELSTIQRVVLRGQQTNLTDTTELLQNWFYYIRYLLLVNSHGLVDHAKALAAGAHPSFQPSPADPRYIFLKTERFKLLREESEQPLRVLQGRNAPRGTTVTEPQSIRNKRKTPQPTTPQAKAAQSSSSSSSTTTSNTASSDQGINATNEEEEDEFVYNMEHEAEYEMLEQANKDRMKKPENKQEQYEEKFGHAYGIIINTLDFELREKLKKSPEFVRNDTAEMDHLILYNLIVKTYGGVTTMKSEAEIIHDLQKNYFTLKQREDQSVADFQMTFIALTKKLEQHGIDVGSEELRAARFKDALCSNANFISEQPWSRN